MKQPSRNFLLSSLAALAATVSPSRAGSNAPGSAPPLAGAPPPFAPSSPVTGRRPWLRQSLRACTAEGLFAELINAFAGGALLTAWALYLGAGPLYTGLLVALPQIAQLFHLPAAFATARLGHRRACLWLVGFARQVTLPLALLPFLPLGDSERRTVLLAVAALAAVLGVLANNAWVAWMGELVPRRIRGRYFGRRTGFCMLGGALAAGAAGLLMDWARARGHVGAALGGLQILACICGAITVVLMRRQHDPAAHTPARTIRLGDVLEPFRDRRVRSVFAYHLAWNGAVGLAGSFLALHLIENLKMGFALLAVHGTAIAVTRMLAAPLWGVLIDRVGARPVLATSSLAVSAIPFLWLFTTPDRLWPLALDALLAGVFWSGHALAAFALPLAVTERRTRPFYVAAFAAVSGLAFTAATALGGALATGLPKTLHLFGHDLANLEILFILSGLLRAGAALLCLRIHEPNAGSGFLLWSQLVGPLLRAPAPVPVPVDARRAPRPHA